MNNARTPNAVFRVFAVKIADHRLVVVFEDDGTSGSNSWTNYECTLDGSLITLDAAHRLADELGLARPEDSEHYWACETLSDQVEEVTAKVDWKQIADGIKADKLATAKKKAAKWLAKS
jgi:hypothetical protein